MQIKKFNKNELNSYCLVDFGNPIHLCFATAVWRDPFVELSSYFGYGERVVNLTVTSAFLASPNCTYELGYQVHCSSQNNENVLLAETHGLLCFEQLKRDLTPSDISYDYTGVLDPSVSDGGSGPSGIANRFITDKPFARLGGGGQTRALRARRRRCNRPAGLVFPHGCTLRSCSVSSLTPASLSLDSYWAGFPHSPANKSSAAPASQTRCSSPTSRCAPSNPPTPRTAPHSPSPTSTPPSIDNAQQFIRLVTWTCSAPYPPLPFFLVAQSLKRPQCVAMIPALSAAAKPHKCTCKLQPSLVGERRAYPVLRGGRRWFDPRQPRRTKRAFVPPLAI
jgi:hypothetical protein